MASAPISLQDVGAKHIPHQDEKFHRETVCDLLHRRNTTFPGAQPVSFARHHLLELQKTDYFMCEKTDGIRCLLYLTELTVEGGEVIEAQFLIDRKNDYYYVERERLHLPTPQDIAGHHVGTLVDGELVRQRFPNGTQRLAYLIFDLLAIDNEDVTPKPFDKRLARIETLIYRPMREFAKRYPQDVDAQPFQIEMKKMEFPYGMEMMFRDRIPNLPHGNDGLIFTCKGTKYVAGTDQHILKWKPPVENTIDFRLLLGEFPWVEDPDDEVDGGFQDWDAMPEMELHVNHGDKKEEGYKYFAPLTLNAAEWEALKGLNQQIDGRIIECYRDPSNTTSDVWRPKLDDGVPRFRDDKTDANHIKTVNSVLESIQDAVTQDDLIAQAGAIRAEFKKRQKAREEEARRAEEMERRKRAEWEKQQAQQQAQRSQGDVKTEEVKEEEEDDGPRYED